MDTRRLKQLDILDGGLRLSNTNRKLKGVLRFNNTTNKLQLYNGVTDISTSNEGWIDINRGIASDNNLGNIKVGDNLFINPDTGKLNAISVGPSMFYQHIVTVSKYNVSISQNVSTNLPNGRQVVGGSGDFTTIHDAIQFISTVTDLDEYPRDKENQWLIYVAPGVYKENFELIPFVSIKGYGKKVSILEPLDNEETHIKMTTDSCLFDLSINYSNELNRENKILIQVNTDLGKVTLNSRTNFSNSVLIKDVDIDISGIDNFIFVKLEKGTLNFEDSFLKLVHDIDDNHNILGFDVGDGK